MSEIEQKEIVSLFLGRGILITETILAEIERHKSELAVMFRDQKNIDLLARTCEESGSFSKLFEKEAEAIEKDTSVEVLFNYTKKAEGKSIQDFVSHFNSRFAAFEKILRERKELENLTQVGRVLKKKDRETVSIIGIISDIATTKNGNLFVTLEDDTGSIKILINKNKPDLFDLCRDLVSDEVIGVKGVNGDGIVFANSIVQPEIPLNSLKTSPDEVYAIFLSDLHVGSKYFLPEEFDKFLRWIRGDIGSSAQKEIVSKVKYVFIIGDLVDGVGIYPGQENELVLKDIYAQYNECHRLLDMIPKDKKLIICPGNHDAMRISEPQPPLNKEYAKPFYDMKNAVLVSNPSVVNIHKKHNHPGINVLLYHGYSFDYYISLVDSIRNNGGYDRADLVMKFLLKRRHLAPSHASTLYIPQNDHDPLIIGPNSELMPDVFATGHIHKTSVSRYRNIALISGSCWQSTTPFQEKVGHHPEPCRVPIMNLMTNEVRVIRFA